MRPFNLQRQTPSPHRQLHFRNIFFYKFSKNLQSSLYIISVVVAVAVVVSIIVSQKYIYEVQNGLTKVYEFVSNRAPRVSPPKYP